MPIIRAKELEFKRNLLCGCMIKFYDLDPKEDLQDWLVVRSKKSEADKWLCQAHKHPGYLSEYWFVLEGEGQIKCGDETYDVEVGDLVITPPDVPHAVYGDITILCTMARNSWNGKTHGGKIPYVATDAPYRDEPEEAGKVGEYIEIDPHAAPTG